MPRALVEDDPDEFIRTIVTDHTERICEVPRPQASNSAVLMDILGWGPNQHAVLYAVRNNSIANLVLA